MFRRIVMVGICLLLSVNAAIAQSSANGSWTASPDSGMEYNCGNISIVISAIGNGGQGLSGIDIGLIVARDASGHELTLQEFVGSEAISLFAHDSNALIALDSIFADPKSTCSEATQSSTNDTLPVDGQFTVVANGNANLRSCGNTDCGVVGATHQGDLLTVVGVNGDWYEVQYGNGTAFIASWLTTRGPDAIVQTDQPYADPRTGCVVVFTMKRGDMDITVILSGTHRNSVLADLYRPSESRPLPVAGQLDKTFIDTGEPYLDQYYSWNIGWTEGTYQLELSANGQTSRLAWELENRGDYYIYIDCG